MSVPSIESRQPGQPQANPRHFNRIRHKPKERTAQAAAQVFAPPPASTPSRSASGAPSIGMNSNGGEDPVEIGSINLFSLTEEEQRLTLEQEGLPLTDDEWGIINEAGLSDYDHRLSAMNLALIRLAIAKQNFNVFRLAVPHILERDKEELKDSLNQFLQLL